MTRCALCDYRAICTYGLTDADDPVEVPVCITHAILLQMALRLDWND